MAANNENPDRRVVPRWRTFREALSANELSSSSITRLPAIDRTPFLQEKEQQWLENDNLVFAIDLVGAATVLGGSPLANRAAEFILENSSKVSPIAVLLARGLLGVEGVEGKQLFSTLPLQIRANLRQLKAKRILQRRNPFVWADLGRLYVLLGQLEPARQALRVARSLAPSERFILRSSVRFFLHAQDPEQALHILRSNTRTPSDPWLVAAEIAVSSLLKKTPQLARTGRQLLANSNLSVFHTSELASALATVEMFDGRHRKAKRLFIRSLTQPTDNSLAQAIWAGPRTGLGDVDVVLLQGPNTAEAKTLDAYNHGEWAKVFENAIEWAKDEAFSARPRVLGSAIASSLLDLPEEAELFAKEGLAINPRHPGLVNNLAFAFICQNKPQLALEVLPDIDRSFITPVEAICLLATTGLAYFRLGNHLEGKKCYELAIKSAADHANEGLGVLATLYLEKELFRIGERKDLEGFSKAQKAAGKFPHTSLPAIAEHLAKEISTVGMDRPQLF